MNKVRRPRFIERLLATYRENHSRVRIVFVDGTTAVGFIRVEDGGMFRLEDAGPSVSRSFGINEVREVGMAPAILPPPKPAPRPIRRPPWWTPKGRRPQ